MPSRLNDLDFVEIGNKFVSANQRRRNTFGIFNRSDYGKITEITSTRECATQTDV